MDERAEMTATIARIGGRRRRRSADVGELAARARDRWAHTPEQRRRLKRVALIAGPIGAVLAAAGAWLLFAPMRQPDYEKDNLRRVFTYTLLTDEFNKLPVEKRLELVGIIVRRVKSMSAGDSALVAAFAAGIAGAAREQIEENASKLAIDTWYMYAEDYADVPAQDRDAYLDRVALELMKMGETLAGEVNDDTDAERLAEAREQAKRDQEMLQSGRGPSTRALARVHQILRDDVGSHASGAQKSRGMLMMRDMVRRMRGESVGGPR